MPVTAPLRSIFGLSVHAVSMQEAVSLCKEAILSRKRLVTGMLNAAKVVHMHRDAYLRSAVQNSDLLLADGAAVVWASRLLGQPLPERVAGIDLFEELLTLSSREGYSVFFLGGEQEVLDGVLERARNQFPGTHIAGGRNGYFSEAEAEDVAREIRSCSPQILFVGITSPKKEMFLDRWGKELGVPVCHGVGGSFDVFAGKVKRAPRIWQRLGLEWLYRLLQEPRRLGGRYLTTNLSFLLLLFRELLKAGLRRPKGRIGNPGNTPGK